MASALLQLKKSFARVFGRDAGNGESKPDTAAAAPPRSQQPPSIVELRTELRERIRAHDPGRTSQLMRHLIVVRHELKRKGWFGVESLPAPVISKALAQAEILASEGSSPAIELLLDRLRVFKVSAEIREERKARMDSLHKAETVEVSEASAEDFSAAEQSWVGTMPGELKGLEPEK